METKKYHLLLILLLCCGGVLLVQRLMRSPRATVAVVRQEDRSPAKANRRDLTSFLQSPAAQSAWERVANRKQGRVWTSVDSEKLRVQDFQRIIDDKLKSIDLGIGGAESLLADFELVDDLRNELEETMVDVVSFEGGTLKLHIPVYPETGKELRNLLQDMLAQDFPGGQSVAIMKLAEPSLMCEFHGLGTMDQTFIVTNAVSDGGIIRVNWTLKLPYLPDKDTLIATGGVWGGSSGTVWYPLSGFEGGSYWALASSLRKYFGTTVDTGKS